MLRMKRQKILIKRFMIFLSRKDGTYVNLGESMYAGKDGGVL